MIGRCQSTVRNLAAIAVAAGLVVQDTRSGTSCWTLRVGSDPDPGHDLEPAQARSAARRPVCPQAPEHPPGPPSSSEPLRGSSSPRSREAPTSPTDPDGWWPPEPDPQPDSVGPAARRHGPRWRQTAPRRARTSPRWQRRAWLAGRGPAPPLPVDRWTAARAVTASIAGSVGWRAHRQVSDRIADRIGEGWSAPELTNALTGPVPDDLANPSGLLLARLEALPRTPPAIAARRRAAATAEGLDAATAFARAIPTDAAIAARTAASRRLADQLQLGVIDEHAEDLDRPETPATDWTVLERSPAGDLDRLIAQGIDPTEAARLVRSAWNARRRRASMARPANSDNPQVPDQ